MSSTAVIEQPEDARVQCSDPAPEPRQAPPPPGLLDDDGGFGPIFSNPFWD